MSISSRPGRFAALLLYFLALPLHADVVRLVNGEILIGSLVGPVAGGVSYEIFGTPVTIPIDSILRTEKNLDALSVETVEIILKDRSVIRGKIVDFDPEIGLFVDIAFGTLTIPGGAVDRVVDPLRRTRYAGTPVQIRAGGGIYFPVLASSDLFGQSWTSVAACLVSVPLIRGLYAGVALSVSGADYLDSGTTQYMFASVEPEIELRFMGWRMNDGFLGKITPFASIRGGMTYVSLRDPDFYPPLAGSLTGSFGLGAGFDIAFFEGFGIRLDGTAGLVVQATTPFMTTGIRLSVNYDF